MEMMPVCKVILVYSTKIAKDFKNGKTASGEMLQVNRWSEYWIPFATLELLYLSTQRNRLWKQATSFYSHGGQNSQFFQKEPVNNLFDDGTESGTS